MDYSLTQDNYSKDEVQGLLDKFVQSETDKVRTTLYSDKIKPLETDLLKYKPVDKSEAEKQLDLKLAELTKKEKALAIKEAGLPIEISDYLSEAADLTKVAELFKSNASYKPTDHKASIEGMTKEKFAELSYSQKAKIFEQSPDLVKNLI